MEEYKRLLRIISDFLVTEGFAKKGNTFYIHSDDNWGLVNFQKSMDSTKTQLKFTINLGIFSTMLDKVLKYGKENKPAIEDCHWKKRVGFLLPAKDDHWWIIENNGLAIEEVAHEIVPILKTLVLPELKKHISDESLISEWLNGISEGATEVQRYIYLTTLLKLHDDQNLDAVVDSFKSYVKGKSYEYTAIEHLKELGLYEK